MREGERTDQDEEEGGSDSKLQVPTRRVTH